MKSARTVEIEEGRTRFERRLKICRNLATCFGLAFVFPVLWLAADRRECVSIKPLAPAMTPDKVRPGDVAIMRWEATPHLDCGGYVIGRTRDAAGIWHEGERGPTVYKNVLEFNGKPQLFEKEFVVPIGAPGAALYDPAIYRWRNFIQEYIWRPAPEHPFRIEYMLLPPRVAPSPPQMRTRTR